MYAKQPRLQTDLLAARQRAASSIASRDCCVDRNRPSDVFTVADRAVCMLQPRKLCDLGTTEDADNPFEGVDLHVRCPKCGAETKLMRLEKFPDFLGEIRVYECGACHHKDEIIGSA